VLSQPVTRQKAVLEQIVAASSAVVSMTAATQDRLFIGYAVNPARISVMPHGASGRRRNPGGTHRRVVPT
jgi:hypothetical protein